MIRKILFRPRRSHSKSHTGCAACKRRRIRCDELFPQCKNCTVHKIRCPYHLLTPRSGTIQNFDMLRVLQTLNVDAMISEWRKTGILPMLSQEPHLALMPSLYKENDLRLICFLAYLYNRQLTNGEAALWTTRIPKYIETAALAPFVMHALLAFTATQIVRLSSCGRAYRQLLKHRILALHGLRKAIGSFSHKASEGIMAASVILSWQATDSFSRNAFQTGIIAVLNATRSLNSDSPI